MRKKREDYKRKQKKQNFKKVIKFNIIHAVKKGLNR